MTIIQAAILGILYMLYCGEIFVPWTYCFIDLMFVSMLTGLILGDVRTGVIVGGTIQPMYLALTAVGGAKARRQMRGRYRVHGHGNHPGNQSGRSPGGSGCCIPGHGAVEYSEPCASGMDAASL